MAQIVVFYHGNCPDGVAAAYAASRAFGEDGAEYIERQPGDALPPVEPGAFVYFLDTTPTRQDLLALAGVARKVTILDHHITAQETLVDLPENVEAIFDLDRSGAQIAWRYFHPKRAEPKVISHIADRDLWKFELRHTREIAAALSSYEHDISIFESLIEEPLVYPQLISRGEAILRLQARQVEEALQQVRCGSVDFIDGFPAVNAPHFLASDVGNALLQRFPNAPFAGVYRDAADGSRRWSLRSMDDRVDVSAIAKRWGGGGHRNAAGMTEPRAEAVITFCGPYPTT